MLFRSWTVKVAEGSDACRWLALNSSMLANKGSECSGASESDDIGVGHLDHSDTISNYAKLLMPITRRERAKTERFGMIGFIGTRTE